MSTPAASEFTVNPSRWIGAAPLYGVQFNQNLFDAVTAADDPGISALQWQTLLDELETTMTGANQLRPHFVRLFFNPDQDAATPSTRDSFLRTVRLAYEAGASVNVTVQSMVPYLDRTPGKSQPAAPNAAKLDELATNVIQAIAEAPWAQARPLWVTLQNEPNTSGLKLITTGVLHSAYLELDMKLEALGLRHANRQLPQRVRFMGGDLIEGHVGAPSAETTWFKYMDHFMADLLDAYSVHIYWSVKQPAKLVARLNEVMSAVHSLGQRKPVYVTEYGVYCFTGGQKNAPTDIFENGVHLPIEASISAAFQHAWFQLHAAGLGYAGTAKWDAYYAMYGVEPQRFYAIGPPTTDGWTLYPMYFLLWLFTNTVRQGWRTVTVEPAPGASATKLLVAFASTDSELTIIGLDHGALGSDGIIEPLGNAAARVVGYAVATGSPHRRFHLIVWNHDSKGNIGSAVGPGLAETIAADSRGIVRFDVGINAVFALTTLVIDIPPARVAPHSAR